MKSPRFNTSHHLTRFNTGRRARNAMLRLHNHWTAKCPNTSNTLRRHLRHGGGWGWSSMALPRRSRSQAGYRGRFFGHCWKPLLILVNFRRQSSPGFFVFCLMTTFWLTATFWLLCVRTGALSPGPCCSKSDCPTLSLSLNNFSQRPQGSDLAK